MSTAAPIVVLSPAWGIKKVQRFNTIAQETTALQNGVYVAGATYPVWDFTVEIPMLTGRPDVPTSEIAQFNGLFNICKGRAGTFLFPDPSDNTVTNYQYATGDGTSKTFQLMRPIGAGSEWVQNVNGVPALYIDGVSTSLYTLDNKGVVTFSTAPALGAALSWTGQFLFLCRFQADSIADMTLFFNNAWSISTIQWSSVNR